MVFIGNADSADGTRNFFLIDREVFAGHERFEVRVDLVLSEKVLSNADLLFQLMQYYELNT